MHGKMHTPRYHGKLYPGWRLPLFPKLNDVEQSFNQVLESHVRNSLRMLLSRQQKTVYPDPNESTLLTIPESVSSLRSLVLPKNEKEVMRPQLTNNNTTVRNSPLISSNPQTLSMSLENTSSANPATWVTAGVEEDIKIQTSNNIASQMVPLIQSSPQWLSSKSTIDGIGELIQGQILSRSIKVGNKSRLYAAGPLEVQIEYPEEPSLVISNSTPRKLAYGIKWLTVKEAERLKEHQANSIIDVESLEEEITYELDDLNYLYIAACGSILKILLYQKIV